MAARKHGNVIASGEYNVLQNFTTKDGLHVDVRAHLQTNSNTLHCGINPKNWKSSVIFDAAWIKKRVEKAKLGACGPIFW